MTTNHPANGPVSLDRLHQIREHLQHDTQYSNGGNRAYILADMLKVIDEVQASRNAEPVLPDEKPMPEASKMHAIDAVAAIAEVRGWNACRAAMLKAGNSPVTQDGYVLVPKEMTPEMMRAVQIKSELGAYATSELSGAYDMFREFWYVACIEACKAR
ncbi:hypothetical protein JAG25_003807 [Citrobacter werkmanii]|nr:hypothetical protein [Citrobacter werkmanii]